MKEEETICWKVNRCVDDLERLLKTNMIDPAAFGERLHQIRKDAQRMENALKLRKEFMGTIEGLEEKYQQKKSGRNKVKGINKIANTNIRQKSHKMAYEFTIKQGDEILYQQPVYGAVLSIVEDINDIDRMGSVDGTVQNLFFGHPLVMWYGFDQLRQGMEGKKIEIMTAMRQAIESNELADPEVKKKIIKAANETLGK